MKKQCYFSQNNIKHIDYKDLDILKKFLNPHARLMSGERTGVSSKNQRKLAVAVKRARFLGLLPFVSRENSKNKKAAECGFFDFAILKLD